MIYKVQTALLSRDFIFFFFLKSNKKLGTFYVVVLLLFMIHEKAYLSLSLSIIYRQIQQP